MKQLRCGFTLIELLIVVAIIAILAAIAVPNFLEAQTRSKVSRVKADMHTIATALECYILDCNNYPNHKPGTNANELAPLTSPIAYITSIPLDPFRDKKGLDATANYDDHYDYVRFRQYMGPNDVTIVSIFPYNDYSFAGKNYGYFMQSLGPDRMQVGYFNFVGPFDFNAYSYDPTNGTVSWGDIFNVKPMS